MLKNISLFILMLSIPLFLSVNLGAEELTAKQMWQGLSAFAKQEALSYVLEERLLLDVDEKYQALFQDKAFAEYVLAKKLCWADRAFIRAIHKKRYSVVQKCINAGINVNTTYFTRVPLMVAILHNDKRMVELLIRAGADVNVRDEYGNMAILSALAQINGPIVNLLIDNGVALPNMSPMLKAILAYDIESARLLIKTGFNVNAEIAGGRNSLAWAVSMGSKEMVLLFLDNDAVRKITCRTLPLKLAAIHGHTEIAELLLKLCPLCEKGADLDLQGPLVLAILHEHKEMVELLIRHGAPFRNNSSLIKGISRGNKEIVELLIKAGADVNGIGKGKTALGRAASKGNQEIIELLLNNNADINTGEESPLFLAVNKGHKKTVELLLQKGASISKATFMGVTVLQNAVLNNNYDIVALLLKNGADVNIVNNDQRTPLMAAAQNCNVDIISLLLSAGAEVNAMDNHGRTALLYVDYVHEESKNHHPTKYQTIKILLANGANPILQDYDGKTLLKVLLEKETNPFFRDCKTFDSAQYNEIKELLIATENRLLAA